MDDRPSADDERRMRLRYAGTCHLCAAPLAARSEAIYDREHRRVRCVSCVPAGTPASLDPQMAAPTDSAIVVELPAEPELLASSPQTAGDPDILRLRAPGSAVIAQTLSMQATAPKRSAIQRFFGVSPLSAEARSWFSGALGEIEVARIIDQLGPEWHAIHALPVGTRGSDLDHLLIGPAGVFTINSKHHQGGKVWLASRNLTVNGRRTDHLRNAEHEATRAAKLLSRGAETPVDVTPIVALVGVGKFTVHERPERVVVLLSPRLASWLRGRPQGLAPAQVAELFDRAVTPATWGHPPIPSADLGAFAELREEFMSARRRRRAWSMGGLVAISMAPFGIAALLPLLLSAFGY
ncbi:NERD domain-containing protein [Microbacterium sp. Sa4CUA7]|uniref:NERD domain-containing protein n=1 Tax=Microbacterium pullorum TaxID=2762236 RepID=A0ABR8RYI9_9MICO|nr:nuclease-related domain-containing protein [Microbacterium pullorum]MBD7956255.1 NERD domain-containing protein [Microbacterium pullorum]